MVRIPTAFIDADLSNADWTKQSWDFPGKTPEQIACLFIGRSVSEVAMLPLMVWNPKEAQPVLAALDRLNAERGR